VSADFLLCVARYAQEVHTRVSHPTTRRAAILLSLSLCLLATVGCTRAAQAPLVAPSAATAVSSPKAGSITQTTTRPAQTTGRVDWPVFDHDAQRSGVNSAETAITADSAGRLRRAWTQALPEKSGGSPILLSSVPMPGGGTRDLLYLTTSHGTTLALDAATGDVVWNQTTSGPTVSNQSCQICATPAADPSRRWVYAAGNDAAVHRYDAASGDEDRTPPWPVTITLMNGYEKRSSALNVANGMLYVALSGYFGDFGPYVGHVLAIRLDDGSVHIFNVLCSDQGQLLASRSIVPSATASCDKREAGVWARSGVVVDQSGGPTDGTVYFASGNGPFDADRGGPDYGDSVMHTSGDASRLIDSYTPSNYQQLDEGDVDLGSTAPALLPTQPQSATPYLAVQGGKDSVLRLLDRSKLGGVGSELQQISLAAGRVMAAPAAWADPQSNAAWVFVAADQTLIGLRVETDASGSTSLSSQWRISGSYTSPIVAGGLLVVAGSDGVFARDPHNGNALWSSAQQSAGGGIGPVHWQGPVVANGCLYIADENAMVSAYCLPNQ